MVAAVVEVVAAVVERDGRYLITRRLEGTHLAGLWEFPGGKILPGEEPEDALRRELHEELGIEAEVTGHREVIEFTYPERTVRLHPIDCRWLSGEPHPTGCEDPRWVAPAELGGYEFPPANAPLLASLHSGPAGHIGRQPVRPL